MHDVQLHKCVLGISLPEKITTVVFLCLCMCIFKYAEICVCVFQSMLVHMLKILILHEIVGLQLLGEKVHISDFVSTPLKTYFRQRILMILTTLDSSILVYAVAPGTVGRAAVARPRAPAVASGAGGTGAGRGVHRPPVSGLRKG